MADSRITFRRYDSAAQVATATVQQILAAAEYAIQRHGHFSVVIAGGRTPLEVYRLLATHDADWERWQLFCGDERCLPVDHPERNSLAVSEILLDRVPIPAVHWHPIPAERGAEMAAAQYDVLIRSQLPFDLVLLGMGEDGHTASLFPGHPVPHDALVIPIHQAPKPPSERVSLTPKALAASHAMLILVTGSGKREALAQWRRGVTLPVAVVAAAGQQVEVLMDGEAADEISTQTESRCQPDTH